MTRNAAAAVVLHHVAYVFCGAGDIRDLNSIEKLALEGAGGRIDHESSWELINIDPNVLSPRFSPAVVPINDTEIAILAGCSIQDG